MPQPHGVTPTDDRVRPKSDARIRIAIVATHPIQHFVPFYRALNEQPDLETQVFFGSRIGLDEYFDVEMNTTVRWEMDLTSGYQHRFLEQAERIKHSSFLAMNNTAIVRALSRYAPDAVVVYGYANIMTWCAIISSIAHRRPILMISDSELLHSRATALGRLKRVVLRWLVGRVAGFLTVGDNNEAYWQSFGAPADKLFRTPFTIDEQAYVRVRGQRRERRADWRRAHGVPPEAVVFLAVGKLSERKRQADIVAALGRVASATPIHLVFAGDGDQRPSLERQAAEAGLPVTFLGFVNVDKLPDVYAAADVLVHASASDPHPLVFSEAACMGLPIVASDRIGAVGPTDIARPGENAAVFAAGDVQSLAVILSGLADNAKRRAEMSAASLAVFETQNMAASVGGLRRAVRSALGRPAEA